MLYRTFYKRKIRNIAYCRAIVVVQILNSSQTNVIYDLYNVDFVSLHVK